MTQSFVWKIENFSYCWPRTGDVLRSPRFTSEYQFMEWTLSLYPRGRRKADRIDCRLTRTDVYHDYDDLKVEYEFSFLNGACVPVNKSDRFRKGFAIGDYHEYSISRDEVLQRPQSFLPHDTLTVRCRVWPCDLECEPQNAFATTGIRVERIAFVWTVENFSAYGKNEESITPVTLGSEECPEFRLRLCPKTEKDDVAVRITQMSKDKENFVRCKMTLLTKTNSEAESMQDEQWFHLYRPKRLWVLRSFLSRERLLKNKGTFLPGDVLSLRCELNVSLGEQKSGSNIRPPPTTTFRTTGCQAELVSPNDNQVWTNLEDDMKRLYRDRLLCDFTLKVGTETFPVHRSLLVARSPVFRAMFQKGMLDDKSETLEIPDLDPDTLNRMLAFIYCEDVKQSGWESSARLYSAADKYHLLPLKDKCRELLKESLDKSNAWEVLLVADKHQDEDLRSTVQGFILEQEKSIIEIEGERKEKRGKTPRTIHSVYLTALAAPQH